MPQRRAISTVAAITLGAVSCVLGLGIVAHSARASTEAAGVRVERRPEAAASLTLGVLGLEPGAVALIGLSGVVSFWPWSRRRTPGPAAAALVPDLGGEPGSAAEVLAPAA